MDEKVEESTAFVEEVERLVAAKERIDCFYVENRQFFEDLNNQIPDLYTSEVAQYTRELADRIKLSMFAPKGWREGQPLVNALPPTPVPEQMRLGALVRYNQQFVSPRNIGSKRDAHQSATSGGSKVASLHQRMHQFWQSSTQSNAEVKDEEMNVEEAVNPSFSETQSSSVTTGEHRRMVVDYDDDYYDDDIS